MSVKNALDSFAFDVIEGAKKTLKDKNINASKKLSNSLDYKLKVSKNSFSLSFFMEDYGDFIDKGVRGVGGSKADGSKWKRKRFASDSPYKYKNKKPPANAFSKWIVQKGFAPRNKKGQFTTRKSLQFAIANSVYHTGIKTTHFFTTPFNREFRNLPDALVEAYSLEVDDLLEFALK